MLIFELLNTTYSYKVTLDHRGIYLAEFHDNAGHIVEVEISTHGDDVWALEFTRDHSTKITGHGEAPAVLSTVSKIVLEFINKKAPAFVVFAAAKSDRARASVYRRMVKRLQGKHYRELNLDQEKQHLKPNIADRLTLLSRRAGGDSELIIIARD